MKLKRLVVFLLIISILGIFSFYYPKIQEITGITSQVTKQAEYPKEPAILLRVIDGDTIEVAFESSAEEKETIRMLGINAPEKKMPLSNESKAFLEQFVNQTIHLQRDVEDEDKYDRKLRYVFYDNRFFNLELLELGYANAYIFEEKMYKEEILRAEEYARENELGIWQKSDDICANCIILEELNATAEFFILKNICNFDCSLDGWFAKDSGRNTFYLQNLGAGEEAGYNSSSSKEVWNDYGDGFFMFDSKGELVVYYAYS